MKRKIILRLGLEISVHTLKDDSWRSKRLFYGLIRDVYGQWFLFFGNNKPIYLGRF